jgi:hypothetical protein
VYKDTTRIIIVLVNTLITFIIGISVYFLFQTWNYSAQQITLVSHSCMLYGVFSNLTILYCPMIYQHLHEPLSQDCLDKDKPRSHKQSPCYGELHPGQHAIQVPQRLTKADESKLFGSFRC